MPATTEKAHPKYTRVAEELRAKISGGELRPGDRLPSLAEMKARAGEFRRLTRAGLRVPQDVALASFDGLQLAEHHSPPLTTMEAPLDETGACGVQRLLQQMKQGTSATEVLEELLSARLVVRGSTTNTTGN